MGIMYLSQVISEQVLFEKYCPKIQMIIYHRCTDFYGAYQSPFKRDR